MGILLFFTISFAVLHNGAYSTENDVNLPCRMCEVSVIALRHFHGLNKTECVVLDIASFICKHFVEHDSFICWSIKNQFREILLSVFNAALNDPKLFCSLLIENCATSRRSNNWTINLPPISGDAKYPDYPAQGSRNFRILQLTDIHVDYKYEPGSLANCRQPLCCRKSNASDFNESQKVAAGYWGTLAKCDIPYWTVKAMLEHIQRSEVIDLVILSGDYIDHGDWSYTKYGHQFKLRNITELIRKSMPNTTVIWTIGNHEGVPVNNFAPHFAPEEDQPHWLYKELQKLQSIWIGDHSASQMKYRGSFAIQLLKGLRLISLNSGYCEETNFWIYINQTDPDESLSWLVSELLEAENDGIYVYILSHISPGRSDCIESWSRNYYKIINRFSKTIKAQFFGHDHRDIFTMFYEDMNDPTSRPTNVLYVSPSVTTFIGVNPAYRIYEISNGHRYDVLDFKTHFFNLSKNISPNESNWEFLYSPKELYNMADLSPASWEDLVDRITYDDDLYQKFLRNAYRRSDVACWEKCRDDLLCTLRKGHNNNSLCGYTSKEVLRQQKNKTVRKIFRQNQRNIPRILQNFLDSLYNFIDQYADKTSWIVRRKWRKAYVLLRRYYKKNVRRCLTRK